METADEKAKAERVRQDGVVGQGGVVVRDGVEGRDGVVGRYGGAVGVRQSVSEGSGTELAPRVWVRMDAVRFRFVRSSGPGGQNVNKVSTACEMRLSLDELNGVMSVGAIERLRGLLGSRLTAAGEILITSDTHRTQEQNREAVLERLREMLVRALVEPKRRKKTKPSRAAKMRRLDNKKRRGQIKSNRREHRGGE